MRYNILFLFSIIFVQFLIHAFEGSTALGETSNVYERVCSVSVCGSLVIRSDLVTDLVVSWISPFRISLIIIINMRKQHFMLYIIVYSSFECTNVSVLFSEPKLAYVNSCYIQNPLNNSRKSLSSNILGERSVSSHGSKWNFILP